MKKRLLCLLLLLGLLFVPALADSELDNHNDSFYHTPIDPSQCLFEVTDVLPLSVEKADADILALAEELTAKTDAKTAAQMAEYVKKNIVIAEDAPLYAPEVLAEKRGSIHGANNLLLALFHAKGLPAVRVTGRVLADGESLLPFAKVNHARCEVLLGNFWTGFDLTDSTAPFQIIRRGPTLDSDDLLEEEGFRYRIKKGGAELCGSNVPLSLPETLGGLPLLSVAEEAFAEGNYEVLTLPDTLKSIGRKAFFNATLPKTLHIPANLTDIGTYAFSYVNGLETVTVDEKNPAYTAKDGVLYDKEEATLLVYPHERKADTFTVPESVELLYCTCFSGNPYLTRVVIPNAETRAMTYTFYGCSLNLYGPTESQVAVRLAAGGLTENLAFFSVKSMPEGSLSHFTDNNLVPQFADLPEGAWYKRDVDSVFRRGILKGLSETVFGGEESVTLAQALTMAVRIRLIYEENATLPSATADEAWYQPALDKALDRQWALPDLSNLDRSATRGEFADILSSALPEGALPQRVAAEKIADVTDPDLHTKVLTLYRGGILTGDPDGNFRPDDTVTRAEAAAILARLTDVTRRIGFASKI